MGNDPSSSSNMPAFSYPKSTYFLPHSSAAGNGIPQPCHLTRKQLVLSEIYTIKTKLRDIEDTLESQATGTTPSSEFTHQLSMLLPELKEIRQELGDHREKLEIAQEDQRLDDLRRQLTNLKNDTEVLESEKVELEDQLENLETDFSMLESENMDLGNQLECSGPQEVELRQQIEAVSSEWDGVKVDVGFVEGKVRENGRMMRKVKGEMMKVEMGF